MAKLLILLGLALGLVFALYEIDLWRLRKPLEIIGPLLYLVAPALGCLALGVFILYWPHRKYQANNFAALGKIKALRFERRLGIALLKVAAWGVVCVSLGLLALSSMGRRESWFLWPVFIVLLVPFFSYVRTHILNTPFFEIDPWGITYWPGKGPTLKCSWERMARIAFFYNRDPLEGFGEGLSNSSEVWKPANALDIWTYQEGEQSARPPAFLVRIPFFPFGPGPKLTDAIRTYVAFIGREEKWKSNSTSL